MTTFSFGGIDCTVTDESGGLVALALASGDDANPLLELKLSVRHAEKITPQKLTVSFSLPCIGMFSTWTPMLGYKKGVMPDWSMISANSRAASSMPVMTVLDASGNNRITLAVSDYKTPITIQAGVNEESCRLVFKIEFFTQLVNKIEAYEAIIRIDQRRLPYYQCIGDVQKGWDTATGPRKVAVPETARLPVYSTWYSFHQALDVDAIIDECRLAKELGIDSIIVDDGWQTVNNERGYAYCGDWEHAPEKVGDMRRFVDRVHETGLKFILWFSVPFVGIHSKAVARFDGKFLRNDDSDIKKLDPRFPEVREFLVDLYKSRVVAYDLDGLKLDFIDAFGLSPDSNQPNPARDYDSLEDAIERLLEETTSALLSIKPDLCIEFRQGYVGPLMRKFGNMLRVTDCPVDALRNRVGVIDLRLTSGNTPVHSDMLMWHAGESIEDAARQITATLFGVPQISVLLGKLPEAHLKMIRFYLRFWLANRDVLLDGELIPLAPEQNYPVVSARRDGKTIAVIYGHGVHKHDPAGDTLLVVNSGDTEDVYVDFGPVERNATGETVDCMGNAADRLGPAKLGGVKRFRVPVSGVLTVTFH